ncbi:MAG: hypothetical protein IPG93_16545 [Burkholderiales bacterium]|nr:hypothetical protein [Burkholderiales bacterium]
MSATVEKKVALTIEMKTAGGQQIGQLTVNLKGLDDASKRAASSGEKTSITLKKISKGFGEIIKIGALATGAVTAVAAAVAGVSVHLASQSGAAQQTALAFGQLDKSLMAAADQSGALKRGLDVVDGAAKNLTKYFGSDEGKKAINGFFQVIVFGAGLAIEKMADLTKAVRHPVDFMEKHLSKWGNFFGMNSKFVEQIKEGDWFDKLVSNAREVGTALKESVLAGKSIVPPTFDDPKLRAEREAAAMAAKEREIARYIELATKATTQEQALNASTLAWFALNEQKKMKITGETASAAIARQEAIADKIRAVNELETQLQNKFQAKYISDLGARADAQADFAEKLRGLRQSQAEYQAELEDKKKSKTTGSGAPTSFLTDMMKAKEAETFMGPKTEEQMAKDESLMKNHADNVMDLAKRIGAGIGSLMSQTITGIVDGSMTRATGNGQHARRNHQHDRADPYRDGHRSACGCRHQRDHGQSRCRCRRCCWTSGDGCRRSHACGRNRRDYGHRCRRRRTCHGRIPKLRFGSCSSYARRVRDPSRTSAPKRGRRARARRLRLKPRRRRWRWRHHQRDPAELRPRHQGGLQSPGP